MYILLLTVNVTCDTENFVMNICYLPHEGYNFSSPDGANMYADQFGTVTECIGGLSPSFCEAGLVGLQLDLSETEREKCGTKFEESTVSKSFSFGRFLV